MSSAVTVRDAREEDLPTVGRLASELVRLHHEYDPQRFMTHGKVQSGYQRWLGSELSNPEAVVLVAELEGAVVGYCYGCLEGRSWADLREACGMLHDIYVDDRARGHGAATSLAREMLRRLAEKGSPRVVLSTAYRNEAAQALFRKLGFRPTMIEWTREAEST